MPAEHAEAHVEIDGITYHTLLEGPAPSAAEAAAAAPPCVLLIHALMANLHTWDSTLAPLHAAGYRTLRYDHPGHGQTPPPQDPSRKYHMDDLTRHAHGILEARTGQSRVSAVVGCSIGGVLAFRYALLYPRDTAAIVSLAAPGIAAPAAAHGLWTQRLALFAQDLREGTTALQRQTVERWIPDNGRGEEIRGARAEAARQVATCGIEGYRVLADAIRDYDYGAQVVEVGRVRTLVVAGELDTAGKPEVLAAVARGIPGAAFVVLPGCGHLPPVQRAGEFEGVMMAFLAERGVGVNGR
ncbi:hypothetical protein LTR53_001993 [Teratosphaeriaceae sp. CCFEE 6253]|nr:hypothetical protein LTR53_001993 [Teratosphaeriaceae sp. CCFEE 6253]